MEARSKLYIALLIFCPAFFYYLYVVNSAAPIAKKLHYIPEKQLVFHYSSPLDSFTYDLSTELNQNVLAAESTGFQLIRDVSTLPADLQGHDDYLE